LISLLDDPDDSVTRVVRERIANMGFPIAGILQNVMRRSENQVLTRRLKRLIADIELDHVFDELCAWREGRDPDLLKGISLILQVVSPSASFDRIFEIVLDISKEVWLELSDQKTMMERIHLFNHIFYHRIRFKAVDPFLKELDKALLDRALETKQANPVLLGLLYMAVADQAGIPVCAMAFPGGFLPACIDENGRILFYINVCQSGEAFALEQLFSLLKEWGFYVTEKQFTPCDAVSLAGIYAESLYFIADNIGDKEMERRLEQTLKFFGDKRILLIEEDDEH
jgi:hypothetical protein